MLIRSVVWFSLSKSVRMSGVRPIYCERPGSLETIGACDRALYWNGSGWFGIVAA